MSARRMVAGAAVLAATVLAAAPLLGPPAGVGRDAQGGEWAELAPPMPGAAAADSLIRDGEKHFAKLWQLTFGGENAEAYWSFGGDRLIFQSTRPPYGCDQIFTMPAFAAGEPALLRQARWEAIFLEGKRVARTDL